MRDKAYASLVDSHEPLLQVTPAVARSSIDEVRFMAQIRLRSLSLVQVLSDDSKKQIFASEIARWIQTMSQASADEPPPPPPAAEAEQEPASESGGAGADGDDDEEGGWMLGDAYAGDVQRMLSKYEVKLKQGAGVSTPAPELMTPCV